MLTIFSQSMTQDFSNEARKRNSLHRQAVCMIIRSKQELKGLLPNTTNFPSCSKDLLNYNQKQNSIMKADSLLSMNTMTLIDLGCRFVYTSSSYGCAKNLSA